MGGFFGAVSANDCVLDVFYGTDYHSHLGTQRGGMTSYSAELGFQRNIHSIENSPFRTKFEKDVEKMRGNICIGCISDTDPQPIMVRSKLGLYAVCSIGIIQNAKALSEELLESGCANFETMSSGNINSGGLIGALIAQKPTFVEGIRYAQSKIEGTMSLVIMTEDSIICARDRAGKLPILIGKRSHREIEGVIGRLRKTPVVVENRADIDRIQLPSDAPLACLTQTTLSVDDCAELFAVLKARFSDIEIKSGICAATSDRQRAVKELAARCPLILVIGSCNSSNSRKLRDVAESCGARARLIASADELKPAELPDVDIGVTSGASAPEYLLQQVVDKLTGAGWEKTK